MLDSHDIITFSHFCSLKGESQSSKAKLAKAKVLFRVAASLKMSGEKKGGSSGEVTKTKNGSFRSIFMHADGVDMLLMALGYIGAIGDGFSTPLVLLLTSKFMNNIGDVSNIPIDIFTHNINKVHLYYSSFIYLFKFSFLSFTQQEANC